MYIGSRGGTGRWINGSLDEIKIFNYALSADQVKADMSLVEEANLQTDSLTLSGTVYNVDGTLAGAGYSVVTENQRVSSGWLTEPKTETREDGTFTTSFLDIFGSNRTKVGDQIVITVTEKATNQIKGRQTYIVTADDVENRETTIAIILLSEALISVQPSSLVSPSVGETLSVDIEIINGENVAGFQFTLTYDETALEFMEVKLGDYLPAGAFAVPAKVDNGSVLYGATAIGATATKTDGTLASLTFRVRQNKASTIGFTSAALNDANAKEIASTIQGVSVLAKAIEQPVGLDGENETSVLSLSKLSIYYDFEQIVDGNIPDRSGNDIHGQIVGDVVLDSDGQSGKAGRFTNMGYLDLNGANVPPALIPTQGFSLLAWVKVEADGDQAIFNARSADTQWLVHPEVRPGGGYYRWTVRTDKPGGTIGEVKKGMPVKNEWHHFAGTYSAGDGVAILYIDGEEVGRDQRDGGTVNKSWGLGARVGLNIDDYRPFTGRMDDFSIWTQTLNQAQIKSIMANGLNAIQPEEKIVSWTIPVQVQSIDPELDLHQLTFGMADGASPAYDLGLDVLSPPSPQPPVQLYAYWQINDSVAPRLLTDYRSPSDSAHYQLMVRADEQPFTLSWDVSSLPSELTRLQLKPISNPDLEPINMKQQRTVTYEAQTQDYVFQLIVSKEQELTLATGWNMISLAGQPLLTDPLSLKGESQTAMLPMFKWNPSGFSYQQVKELKLGEGYWMLSLSKEGESLSLPLKAVDNYSV
ncbi:MAG: cohesin domain-containing protein, partial [Candidatus Poribacteria bacterium]|nr:cohesin domain-containing protein [Candidatus Poribacteria bacterium]